MAKKQEGNSNQFEAQKTEQTSVETQAAVGGAEKPKTRKPRAKKTLEKPETQGEQTGETAKKVSAAGSAKKKAAAGTSAPKKKRAAAPKAGTSAKSTRKKASTAKSVSNADADGSPELAKASDTPEEVTVLAGVSELAVAQEIRVETDAVQVQEAAVEQVQETASAPKWENLFSAQPEELAALPLESFEESTPEDDLLARMTQAAQNDKALVEDRTQEKAELAMQTEPQPTPTADQTQPAPTSKSFFDRLRKWFAADGVMLQEAAPALAKQPQDAEDSAVMTHGIADKESIEEIPTEPQPEHAVESILNQIQEHTDGETFVLAELVKTVEVGDVLEAEANGEAQATERSEEAVALEKSEETNRSEAIDMTETVDSTKVKDAAEAEDSAEAVDGAEAEDNAEAVDGAKALNNAEAASSAEAEAISPEADRADAHGTCDTEGFAPQESVEEISAAQEGADFQPVTPAQALEQTKTSAAPLSGALNASTVSNATEQNRSLLGTLGGALRKWFGPQDAVQNEQEPKTFAEEDATLSALSRVTQQEDMQPSGNAAPAGEEAAQPLEVVGNEAVVTDAATQEALVQAPLAQEKASGGGTGELPLDVCEESQRTEEAGVETSKAVESAAEEEESTVVESSGQTATEIAGEHEGIQARRKHKRAQKKAQHAAERCKQMQNEGEAQGEQPALAAEQTTQAGQEMELATLSLTETVTAQHAVVQDGEAPQETKEPEIAFSFEETTDETTQDAHVVADEKAETRGEAEPAIPLDAKEKENADEEEPSDESREVAVHPRRRVPVFKVFMGFTAVITFMMSLFIVMLFLMSDNTLLKPKNEVPLPNFNGKDVSEVAGNPEFSNFTIAFEDVYTSEFEKGVIVDQRPKAPRQVKENAKIVLRVSAGIKTVEMPNVVGMDSDEAKQLVRDSDLNVLFKPTEDEGAKQNAVVETEPRSGTVVNAGETVTLYIGRGEQDDITAKVPNCIGMTSTTSAGQVLSSRGLSMGAVRKVASGEPAGMIIGQSPAAGSTEPRGTPVILTVSAGTVAGGGNEAGMAQDGHVHAFVVTPVAATETVPGFTIHTCTICGFYTLGNIG